MKTGNSRLRRHIIGVIQKHKTRDLKKDASPSLAFHRAIPVRLSDLTPPPVPSCRILLIAYTDGQQYRQLVYQKEEKETSTTSAALNLMHSTEFTQTKEEKIYHIVEDEDSRCSKINK